MVLALHWPRTDSTNLPLEMPCIEHVARADIRLAGTYKTGWALRDTSLHRAGHPAVASDDRCDPDDAERSELVRAFGRASRAGALYACLAQVRPSNPRFTFDYFFRCQTSLQCEYAKGECSCPCSTTGNRCYLICAGWLRRMVGMEDSNPEGPPPAAQPQQATTPSANQLDAAAGWRAVRRVLIRHGEPPSR